MKKVVLFLTIIMLISATLLSCSTTSYTRGKYAYSSKYYDTPGEALRNVSSPYSSKKDIDFVAFDDYNGMYICVAMLRNKDTLMIAEMLTRDKQYFAFSNYSTFLDEESVALYYSPKSGIRYKQSFTYGEDGNASGKTYYAVFFDENALSLVDDSYQIRPYVVDSLDPFWFVYKVEKN